MSTQPSETPKPFGMGRRLCLKIHSQPTAATCGPTCLHAVYDYYGDEMGLETLIRDVPALEEGGTLAVLMACHALRRGYQATVCTYNLTVFDPTAPPFRAACPKRIGASARRRQIRHS